ncbi:13025_t:CDS:1 [Ambispora leptoticha]|uniref:13025_t:CDS:1 n=1 Tax=Ambispora leptoticha TaxID=144679 RepID=A0A9N8WNJ4_9GLOM|nr:13025_t:CDS:1 [Ambispora leptoticha]
MPSTPFPENSVNWEVYLDSDTDVSQSKNDNNSTSVFENLVSENRDIEQFTMPVSETENSFVPKNSFNLREIPLEADGGFNLISNDFFPIELIENMPTIDNRFSEKFEIIDANSQFSFNNNSFEFFEAFIFGESINTTVTFQPEQEALIFDQDSFLFEQQEPLIYDPEIE